MEVLSLAGIFAGLILMIVLAYRGYSIIWVAPMCAFVVELFALGAGLGEGRTLLSSYTTDYMQGAGNYFISWFPIFLLGAIFGKAMDMTGAAQELAQVIVKIVGTRLAVLAVLIPCMVLTYGGVSLFVVVFIMYPMGYSIFKEANLPRTLLPGIIAFGSMGVTMTTIPGTPQIQNLIPMEYFGTTATAAPVFGIVEAVIVGVLGYLYLDRQAGKAVAAGIGFEEDELFAIKSADEDNKEKSDFKWIFGLLPLCTVFVCLNILHLEIVISLILGIISCFVFHIDKIKTLPDALTEGAKGSITAMMNTACAVGFGAVVKIAPGFILMTTMFAGHMTTPVSLLLSETISTGVLAGAIGSASGGIPVALSVFGEQYMAAADTMGISPDILHRVAAIAAGALDKLPHNGAIITLLTVAHCTHKESYRDIFIVGVAIPLTVAIVSVVILGIVLNMVGTTACFFVTN